MPSSPRDASLGRQRREDVRTGTGAPVPVPDPTILVFLADPDHLDTRRRLPHGQVGTPVPEVGPACGVVEYSVGSTETRKPTKNMPLSMSTTSAAKRET